MMKILLITDTYIPAGGAEKHFYTLKQELQKRTDLQVYSLSFGTFKAQNRDAIVLKETSSKFLRQWWRMFFNFSKYQEIKRAINKIKPDVIHLHNVKKYTISLLKAVRDYPVIQTVHDFSPICPTGWNLHDNLEPCPTGLQRKCFWRHKRGLNFASYLALAFSFYRMRDLLKNTVRKFIAPSPLLEHYLRLNQFGATVYLPPFGKPQLSPPTFTRMQPRHFLFVGQLEIQKGVDVLVEEFALACRQDTNLILKIAGSGSQENSLKQKVKDLNLEKNILFLGWIDPDKYYEECMALIFSSMGLESFGMVITETMAKGRAVIGSNRGPTTWLVEDGKSGLLFDPLIKGDLASKILLLACDTTLAQQMGEAGFQKLNIFSDQESVVDNIVSLYSSVQ